MVKFRIHIYAFDLMIIITGFQIRPTMRVMEKLSAYLLGAILTLGLDHVHTWEMGTMVLVDVDDVVQG